MCFPLTGSKVIAHNKSSPGLHHAVGVDSADIAAAPHLLNYCLLSTAVIVSIGGFAYAYVWWGQFISFFNDACTAVPHQVSCSVMVTLGWRKKTCNLTRITTARNNSYGVRMFYDEPAELAARPNSRAHNIARRGYSRMFPLRHCKIKAERLLLLLSPLPPAAVQSKPIAELMRNNPSCASGNFNRNTPSPCSRTMYVHTSTQQYLSRFICTNTNHYKTPPRM